MSALISWLQWIPLMCINRHICRLWMQLDLSWKLLSVYLCSRLGLLLQDDDDEESRFLQGLICSLGGVLVQAGMVTKNKTLYSRHKTYLVCSLVTHFVCCQMQQSIKYLVSDPYISCLKCTLVIFTSPLSALYNISKESFCNEVPVLELAFCSPFLLWLPPATPLKTNHRGKAIIWKALSEARNLITFQLGHIQMQHQSSLMSWKMARNQISAMYGKKWEGRTDYVSVGQEEDGGGGSGESGGFFRRRVLWFKAAKPLVFC